MVTSYYLHMISSANTRSNAAPKPTTKFDISGYYSNVLDIAPRSSGKSLCRICLREGSIPIEGNRDIAEALAAFANVTMSESKDYPKHLCDVCHKFLKGAVMFRKRAKLTNKILKKSLSSSIPVKKEKVKVKEEKFEKDDDDYYPDSPPEPQQNDDSNDEGNTSVNETNISNEPPQKLPPKDSKEYRFLINNRRKTCTICNKSFNRKYIKMHMTLHNPEHINEHTCEVCGKSFRLYSNLQSHLQRYHKPRKPETLSNFKFKCDHCPYRARQRNKLNKHMIIHGGVKAHMCTICPAKFHHAGNLRQHLLRHKEPQVQCDSCDKMFRTESIMKNHYEAEHLGILKHICHICGKAFGYRKPLRVHQRFVHKMEKLDFKVMPAYIRVQLENQNQSSEPTTSQME